MRGSQPSILVRTFSLFTSFELAGLGSALYVPDNGSYLGEHKASALKFLVPTAAFEKGEVRLSWTLPSLSAKRCKLCSRA